MKITANCYATLAPNAPDTEDRGVELPPGATVTELLEVLGIDPQLVKLIFVNGVHGNRASVLKDGDSVGLFPPVGGG